MSLSAFADGLFAVTCLPLAFAAALTLARLVFIIFYLPVHFSLNRRDVAFDTRHVVVARSYTVIAWIIIALGAIGAVSVALR